MSSKNTANFSNVAGYEAVKEELNTIINWYNNKEILNNENVFLPTGILFFGSPGNGKTLFVRELIKAFNAPTYVINGKKNQIEEIQDVFNKARKEKFAVVVIDELDMLIDDSKDIERVLQSELDGINKEGRIIVLATTNKIDAISEALQRQGRFDRVIRIGYPSRESRASLINYYLNKLKVDTKNIDIEHICDIITHTTGSEIKAVINDAYLRNKNVTTVDIENSYERIIHHDFVKIDYLKYKDHVCAIHEAGHVLMTLKYQKNFRVYNAKFLINGGVTRTYPTQQLKFNTVEILNQKIQICLAGPIAEQLFFKRHDCGISGDLDDAHLYAKELNDRVSDKHFKSFVTLYQHEYERPDTNIHKRYNEKRIYKIIKKQYKMTKHYLKKHKKEIKLIADALYNKGILSYHEINDLLGINDSRVSNDPIKEASLAYAKKTN